MTSKELAKIAYNALDDKKGVNITIIDISEISIIADYFIIWLLYTSTSPLDGLHNRIKSKDWNKINNEER